MQKQDDCCCHQHTKNRPQCSQTTKIPTAPAVTTPSLCMSNSPAAVNSTTTVFSHSSLLTCTLFPSGNVRCTPLKSCPSIGSPAGCALFILAVCVARVVVTGRAESWSKLQPRYSSRSLGAVKLDGGKMKCQFRQGLTRPNSATSQHTTSDRAPTAGTAVARNTHT